MKKLTDIFLGVIAFVAMTGVFSCTSNEDDLSINDSSQPTFCKLNFNVTKEGFDDEIGTRSATQWENGDTIYLLFTSGTDLVYGDAVYNDGEWFVNYNGTLVSNQETTCRAIYFENSVSSNHSTITLNENSAIYEDNAGKYTLTDGSLSVTANLKPLTGRLRLKGSNHEEVKLYGITYNTSFNRYTGQYTTSKGIIKAKVDTEYTPYIYGSFTDSNEPRLNLWKAAEGFTRIFPTTIYKAGESGFITIPTSSAHNGWQNNITFKVNDIEFTMIPIQYTNGNFLMAQTETTEELYEALMDDGDSSQLPKSLLTYTQWNTFINTLNSLTELTFRMPTYNEWVYAFNGGSSSQYTYSGSNDINEVAWYADNSNKNKHVVATKQPNQFGFYDMSGNLYEFVTGGSYDAYGGSYSASSANCTSSGRIDWTNSVMDQIGLRLAMSNN